MNNNGKAINELLQVMDRLLAPDGCPWDREQSHESLTRYLIEECYEVIDAVKRKEMDKLKEELGDVLLQVVFHAALAEREGCFDFDDVARAVCQKMKDRHPHVFGTLDIRTSGEVMDIWENLKKREGKKYVLEGIPAMLPALMRAEKMQQKAARVGFDWPVIAGAVDKVKEEVEEFAQAESPVEASQEFGDILFALVNVARMKGIDPEAALQESNDKFERRFQYIEENLQAQQRSLTDTPLEEMDRLWEEAKDRGL